MILTQLINHTTFVQFLLDTELQNLQRWNSLWSDSVFFYLSRRMVFLPLVFGEPIPTKMVGKLGAFRKDLEDNSRLSASWAWLFSVGLVVGFFLFWSTRFLEFRDVEHVSWLKSDNLAIWTKTHQVKYTEFHVSFSLIQSSIVAEIACLGRFAACRCTKTF